MPATPVVYLLCGPSLAGKSTFCRRLAETLGLAVASADAINDARGLPFGAAGLPESVWAETLRLQLETLREAAAIGQSLIIDDTLCYRWLRDRFRDEAEAVGMLHELLLFAPAREELLARHAALASSGLRPLLSHAHFVLHLASFEWPTADEAPVDITTVERQETWIQVALSSRQ